MHTHIGSHKAHSKGRGAKTTMTAVGYIKRLQTQRLGSDHTAPHNLSASCICVCVGGCVWEMTGEPLELNVNRYSHTHISTIKSWALIITTLSSTSRSSQNNLRGTTKLGILTQWKISCWHLWHLKKNWANQQREGFKMSWSQDVWQQELLFVQLVWS